MSVLSRIESHQASAYLYELDEKCWKEVVREQSGIEVIRAAKVFRDKKLSPPVPKSKISFVCGNDKVIEPEYRVALKKDSPFFAGLFFENDITLTNVTLEQFEMLLKVLYEDVPFDALEHLKLANYLNIPCLFHKAYSRLRDSISNLSLEGALQFHDSLIPLYQFPFAKELLEELSKIVEKFDHTKITGVASLCLVKNIFLNFSAFTKLRSLRISHPDVEEEALVLPSSLEELSLTLSKTIADASISRFPTNLRALMLGCTKITDKGLNYLPAYLTALNVGGCSEVSDTGLAKIPLTVTDLNVSNTKVTIASITLLTALTRINICGCNIRGSDLSRLSVVELSLSHVKNDEISLLPRVLRKLNFFDCKIASLEGLPPVIDLRAANCSFDDDNLLYLTRGLTFLDLSFNTSITALGMILIPRTVRYLTLWRCTNINDDALKALPRRLLYLDISGCAKVTNEGIKLLPRSLTELDIDGCGKITNEAIPFLPVNLSKIHYAKTQITKKL